MSSLIGQTFGQYQIVEQIGQGGMAMVFRARQPGLERDVALKVLPLLYAAYPGFSDRFQREAKAIASLNHPNILPVHDFGEHDGYSFITMRYIEDAQTFGDVLGNSPDPDQIINIIGQIAAALGYAHSRGVVHRDVKPSNVLMDDDWALLSDFGLAKMIEGATQVTDTGAAVGTPAYMSPEQARGRKVDGRTDIFALGIMLFEGISGQNPLDKGSVYSTLEEVLSERQVDTTPLMGKAPPTLIRLIEKAVAKNRDLRYATCEAFISDLETCLTDSANLSATVLTPPPRQAAAVEKVEAVPTFDGGAIRRQIHKLFIGGPDEQRALRNRQAMLKLVNDFWIEGVLDNSLHGAALIELGLEARPEAVERPWEMVLQIPDQPNQALPPGTQIADVYESMGHSLLILGEPGAGKTTMLLELARDLIKAAEQDPSEPIPVIFNLSSWEGDGGRFQKSTHAFEAWLVDELRAKYNIPKKIAEPWVENDQLLLLLDGLDEAAADRRDSCVEAINAFREEHFVPIVVCSRISDYDALSSQLKLQGAVILQPLTEQQVDLYLEATGPELSSVREMLTEDATLRELTQSPLMLSILTLAYRGVAPELLPAFDSIEARRKHLFETYVQRMFERRGVGARYTPADTKKWLAWIAQKMQERGQSVFLVERLQPGWLNSKGLQWIYTFGYWLLSGLIVYLVFRFNWGIFIGLLLWLSSTVEKNILSSVWDVLLFGSGFGLFLGPFFLVYGLILILIKRGQTKSINTVEVLNWSWAGVRSELNLKDDRPTNKLAVVIGGLVPLSLIGYAMNQQYWWTFTFIGILGGSLYILSSGLNNKEVEATVLPNQGIWQSAKNALIIAGISGLSFGISFGLPFSLGIVLSLGSEYEMWVVGVLGLILMLEFGWPLGTLAALIGGLWYGGLAVIQHFVLRFILWRKRYLPWNLAPFLDYAAERIFLRKVGGGYIFAHRLLLEYFAALEHEKRQNV